MAVAPDPGEGSLHYDPLLTEIGRLSRDGRQETQERLVSRIVGACVADPVITAFEIALRKSPGPIGSGAVEVRVSLDADTLTGLRLLKVARTDASRASSLSDVSAGAC